MSTLNTTNLKNESSVTNNIVLGADGSINLDAGTLYVDAGNNRVGLGTSTPGTNTSNNANQLVVGDNSAAAERGITIGSTTGGSIRFNDGADAGQIEYNHASNYMRFVTNSSTEGLRIDSAGRVGIGTTSPGASLDVCPVSDRGLQVSGNASGYVQLTGTQGTTSSNLRDMRIVAQTLAFGTGAATGTTYTEKARLTEDGKLLVGTSTSRDSNSLIQAYKDSGNANIWTESASLANNQQTSFVAKGNTSGGNERNVEIGLYKHAGITNPGPFLFLEAEDGANRYYWTDNSDILRSSASANDVGTTNGTVIGTQTSDGRLKDILGPVEYGLDTIKQIEPVCYSLKSQPHIEQLGFVAQQVQPLVPQSVFDTGEHIEGEPEDAPTKLGMEYVALIPVLVNAIKELSAEVDALKAQLQAS